jgi:hypothetical protein
MSETIVLTTPEPAITEYRIREVEFFIVGNKWIRVIYEALEDERKTVAHTITEAAADTILTAVNQGVRDGTGKTLQRWLMEKAVADGIFAGTPSGEPE